MATHKKLINLLPQEEFEASTLGRILRWAMTTFRIIVIVTEMIVMAAFLSRFWLDSQNSDLTDEIKIQTAQIAVQSDFETEFTNFQKQLTVFKEIDKSTKYSGVLLKITTSVPSEITLESISVQDNSAQIKGTALSEVGIAQYSSNLKADKFFKKVSLGQINSSQNNESLTVFNLDLNY